ncbi:hypothetical protein O181_110996 [Austropuccinia psidii MF-1]|uniref:Uncharacterized protein n=1 Tax=Austropuccinia psidii MF-1 TaxID=1389203 RepID=A0A9Q3PSB2_9BASI|nr:hypothetical protein [Austropuccinia psidii MF-1]
MSAHANGGSPSAFHRENSGSSSQNPPTEGDSIMNSDEENHKSIHTDSTGQKSIFLQDLERLGIEDAVAQNASQEGQEEITSGVVGVELRIQQEEDQQRARNNKRILQGRNHRITRLVAKNDLPSQASTESVHLQEFIYFLMAKHIKTHLETFEYGLRDHPILERKILVKQEITSISQQSQPPEFTPSCDVLNDKIKVSIVENHSCKKECQLVGLKRITFQWGTSFNNSTWNAAIGDIISKHFFNWSQTQPSLNINNPDQLNLLIECWVNGSGKEINKLSKLGQAEEEVKFPKAKKSKNTGGRQNATSDVEDNSDLGKAPKRLVGVWRSEVLNLCTRQLNLAITLGANTQLEKNRVQRMLHRDGEKLNYNSDLTNVPHCLPLDFYSTIYLNTSSEVERSHFLVKEPIAIQNIFLEIEAKTKRGRQFIQRTGRSSLSGIEAGSSSHNHMNPE